MKTQCRIQQLFENKKAFIAYLTTGDGGVERSLEAALALIEGGVNMLEIGIPFSDPVADGPIIQRASARALAADTTQQDVLWLAQQIRQRSDLPLVLYSYLNPILAAPEFLAEAKNSGIDGLLIVDCPLEESEFIRQQCMQNDIALIYVLTENTPLARILKINHHAQGFLYYACRKGTTGVRTDLPEDFPEKIKTIKANVTLPVVVGFGISNQAMANAVLEYADGVVVGSLFIDAIEKGTSPAVLTSLARNIYPVLD